MKNRKTLKQLILGSLLLLSTNSLFAQTQKVQTLQAKSSSGATIMNTDALIQMDSNNKGLLLPRIALTGANQVAPLTAHTAGMVVYNTATVATTATIEAVTPGYYYNNGTKWVKIANTDTSDVTDDAWVNNTTTNVVELATKADGTTIRATGEEVVITDEGYVGIGTEKPKGRLTVSDSIGASYFPTFDTRGVNFKFGSPTFNKNIYPGSISVGAVLRMSVDDGYIGKSIIGTQASVEIPENRTGGDLTTDSFFNGLVGGATNRSSVDVKKMVGTKAYVLNVGSGNIHESISFEAYIHNGGTGTINNGYGLLVRGITSATNNYAIYTNEGKVSLGDVLVLRHKGNVPTSSSDSSGVNGEIRYDGNFIYIKVDNAWKRSALTSF